MFICCVVVDNYVCVVVVFMFFAHFVLLYKYKPNSLKSKNVDWMIPNHSCNLSCKYL